MKFVNEAGAGQGGYADRARSRIDEGPGGGAGGGAGGVDIVDDEDVLLGDGGGIGDAEGSADVDAALVGGEAGLAVGGADT